MCCPIVGQLNRDDNNLKLRILRQISVGYDRTQGGSLNSLALVMRMKRLRAAY